MRRIGLETPRLQASVKIIIVDDHPLFREALRRALETILPEAGVSECAGLDPLQEMLGRSRDVDLVLLDLTMPGVQGFSGLIYLRAQYPEIPIVIVSATEDPVVIRRAVSFGASGFIPKSLDLDGIGNAVRTVLSGDIWAPPDVDLEAGDDRETSDLVRRLGRLTPQQMRVLMMLSEGLLNREGACLGHPAEARRRQPHPGRHRGRPHRRDGTGGRVNEAAARLVFERFLRTQAEVVGKALAVVPNATCRVAGGWCFYYQSRAYLETGDYSLCLVGQGPKLRCVAPLRVERLNPFGAIAPERLGHPRDLLVGEQHRLPDLQGHRVLPA